jgi:surfeit locus 1 family protein
MSAMQRRKSLLIPGVMTVAGLAVLLALGQWQLQRKAWKEGLMSSIEAALSSAPVPLEQPPQGWSELLAHEYAPVTVTGTFRHNYERHLYTVREGLAGWHIYTPLDTEGGDVVYVNRGFVPEMLKEPGARRAGNVAGPVTVTGFLRKPGRRGTFSPEADVAKNVWYWRDLDGMAASLGGERSAGRILPFFVEVKVEPENPGGWPQGGVTRLDIPNRHLEYALTWFGLAGALAAVFLAYAMPRWRKTGE